ncbi:hypothetical protein DNTS_018354 [Danionella cerebrum]|uniref:Intraflagellar transport protein 46 homolog n=1 Tax=Danionella cerebrum TaxID=2873325 RepID=A0A553QKQ2_9TELE|nr:hypothetical protein DNTS_018354 [Danionella translucida]
MMGLGVMLYKFLRSINSLGLNRQLNCKGLCNQIQVTTNQPYDESFEVNAEESVSVHTPSPRQTVSRKTDRQKSAMASYAGDKLQEATKRKKEPQPGAKKNAEEDDEEDDDDDDDDEDSDDTESDEEEESGNAPEGVYDPADYEHLPVTAEVKELFQYITRYTPQTIELDHKLKPFIPDFIPAVGDIDAFLKVPRPDGKPDNLGLLVLDEPCTKQSDPTVLSLWLSENSKQHNVAEVKVRSIENPEKNPKAIENWIESISELHRSKPPATVHYTRIVYQSVHQVNLPTADLDCDLTQYVDIICGILDIPVYKNRIHSLHVLFTLYSEFRNSQHFKTVTEGQKSDTPPASRTATADLERLALD